VPRGLAAALALLLAYSVLPAAEPSNVRKPTDDAELKYWLQNMRGVVLCKTAQFLRRFQAGRRRIVRTAVD
jgi:hypothetical protein